MVASLSRHASGRARQRGVTEAQVGAVIKYADQCVERGRGTELIWASPRALASLGPKTPEGVDVNRLKNLYVLVTSDEIVVTVYRAAKGR